MNVAGLVKTSTVDYPGKLACVVFTAGCNYDCRFCHNRALLSNPPLLDEKEVHAFLTKRVNLLEGVVISGGEPTLQKDLIPFASRIKELGYAVKLDTNGSDPEILNQLLQRALVDYVAVDYKAPFQKYPDVCGQPATGVAECVDMLRKSSVAWELRTTVIPQLGIGDLMAMAQTLPALPLYALQRYRPVNGEGEDAVYSPSQIKKLAEVVKKVQPNTVVRA